MGEQLPIDGRRQDDLVAGKADPRGAHGVQTQRGQPDRNTARAPAYVATPEFRRQAEAAMRREEIPPAYRDQVKDYFDAIRGP